jgi:hypothetical protein
MTLAVINLSQEYVARIYADLPNRFKVFLSARARSMNFEEIPIPRLDADERIREAIVQS